MNKFFSRTSSRGFTLIELLVVIFIIGLLASIVVVSVQTARVKARDVRRIADASTIKTALELYNDLKGEYPDNTDHDPDPVSADVGNLASYPLPDTFIQPLVDENILSFVPRNPQNNNGGYYWYNKYGYNPTDPGWNQCGTSIYVLQVQLERDRSNYNAQSQIPSCVGNVWWKQRDSDNLKNYTITGLE